MSRSLIPAEDTISDPRGLKPEAMTAGVVRSFWHGPFSPYEALCLSSFIAAGIGVELFSQEPLSGLPDGVTARKARDILDCDVAFYRHEPDGPSPALHANHFRYALLEKLGGWWIDSDIMLVGSVLPAAGVFLARQSDAELNCAVMHFPVRHPLMTSARERTEAVLETARWAETGPKLVTELLPVHEPDAAIAARESAYAIGHEEFQKFLLPEAREEVEQRTANSTFVHLWNEMWRRSGIPKDIGPPKGSWIDMMFERHAIPVVWSDRMDAAQVKTWDSARRERERTGRSVAQDAPAQPDPSGISRVFREIRARLHQRFRNSPD